MRVSSVSSAPNWCKSTSARELVWYANCSRWPARKRLVSFSSTKSTPSEVFRKTNQQMYFLTIICILGARFDDGAGGDNEVQRTMLELINQLDGFDPRGNIKVLMATNRPDTLDPALMRPGRLDRKVEFGLPDLEGRTHIFKIHARSMSVERDIRFELLARLCPNSTGAEIRFVLSVSILKRSN